MNWIKPIFLRLFKTSRVQHLSISNKKIKPSFSLETLEPKILLSAELVGGVIDGSVYIADDGAHSFNSQGEFDQWVSQLSGNESSVLSSNIKAMLSDSEDITFEGLETFLSDQQAQTNHPEFDPLISDNNLSSTSLEDSSLELIIIDPRTPDYLELVEGVSTDSDSNYLIYVLDPDLDGVQQITDLLALHNDLNAVHIVSHGSEGNLQLGTSWLSSDNLDQYAEQISTWQNVFDDDADILIYGCDLAANTSGVELINSLAELTGTDVSASDDATGLAELGGDWELEYQTGNIETQIAFNQEAQNTWQHTLLTESNLWISFNGTGGGTPGGGFSNQLLSFSDPDLALELGDGDSGETDGTFSAEYTLPENVRAAHYISSAVTVDTLIEGVAGSYNLEVGQVVLSMQADGNADITVEKVGGGSLVVNNSDLLVYSPSEDAYELLLDDAILESDGTTVADIYAISIVESDTTIGVDSTLTAGTYLIASSDTTIQSDISTYSNAEGLQALLSGSDFLDDPEEQIQGLEFIETETIIGGQTLTEGQILVTVTTNNANPVGGLDDPINVGSASTTVEASQKDIVVLTVNGTEQDSSEITDVDAQILFDASDISLTVFKDLFTGGEVNALTLFSTTTLPEATNLTQSVDYTEGADSVALDDIVITGIDSSEMVTATLTLADVQAGVLNTGSFGDATSAYNSDSGIWSVTGSLVDVNAALASVAFVPTTNNDVNTSITTHIEDLSGTGPSDGLISLNVSAENDVPTVTNLTQVQAYEEGASSVALDDIVISDVDTGETITATLTLTNTNTGILTTGTFGSTTSSYDSGAGVWSVTGSVIDVNAALADVAFVPTTNNDINTSLTSHIEDSAGAGPTDGSITLTVTALNDDPTLDNNIPDQTVDQDSLLNFTFDANTFSDIDTGDSLSYSAQLAGGGILPSWLNFNASTRTFSGTPLNENVGTLSVEVIADDGQGGTPATDSFDIVVSNINDDPSLDNEISDQNATEDSVFSFTFAADTFNDIDSGDSLTYSAQLAGGATLPTWLNFDSSTRTFSGTPANDDVGSLSIEVIADDGHAGTTATTTFNLVIANSNDAPTGAITINGNAIEYQTLTINTSMLSDDDGLGVFSYQWLRDANAISGAIYNSYALDNADVGSVISYQVNYTDGRGSYETVTSSETAIIANINDSPTGSVSITGTATVGSTLTASNNLADDDGLGSISYQWQRNGVDITGATGNTYDITVLDDNQTLNVIASYTDLNSTLETVYSAATATVTGTNYTPTGSVDIIGLAQEGETLTTDTSTLADADGLGSFSYQWQRDGVNISGATGSSYVLDNDDVGYTVKVVITYLDTGLPVGTVESVSSDASAVVANINGAPSATGMNQSKSYIEGDVNIALNDIVVSDADIGDIITATLTLDDVSTGVLTTGTFGLATSTYDTATGVWTVTGTVVDVNSALADVAFAPATNNDVNTSITTHIEDALATGPSDGVIYLLVNAMNDAPTLENAIANQIAIEDSNFSFTLASDTFSDVDTGIFLNYTAQLADGGSLPGWLSFNNSTRTFSGTPLNDDVGIINIKVAASDGQGSSEVSDSFTITISNTNDVPSGNVTIMGTAAEGQLLTADTSSIYDQDGIGTFSYQWLRDGLSISDQTNNTYTLTDADVGSQISVLVSYVDARGSNESLTSLATTSVLNINDAPTAFNQTQSKNYTEGDSSVAFDDIVVADLDNSEIINATLVLSKPTAGSLSTGTFGSSTSNYNNATGVWTVSGSVIDVNAALASVEFLPDVNNDIDVTVTTHIEDALGAGPSDGIISLNVNALNDDPTLNNAIANQNATEDSLFSFTFASDTFTDVDAGAVLTYSAQLADGSALPSWLSFDANTRTFTGTPENADVGSLSVEITADDGLGGTPATDSFDLLVANTNDDPVVNNPIANQNATEDSLFSFTFASDTFTDLDVDSVLTYSAQLSDGSALPSWLSFDADTRTFSGSPLNGDVGSLSIEVTADDGLGGTPATDSFDLLIANTNDDPVVNNAIANQNATEDSLFSFTFASDTFTDLDVDSVLTYSAQLSDGSALPSWLSFDADTRTFSGTPLNGDVGSLSIEVSADDGLGGTPATDSFDLLIANTNDDPVVNNAIANQNATEDSLFSFTFASDTFTDLDVDSVLTYSAQLSDGSALPSWLSFDADTRTFSGTPLNGNVGSLSIEVTADDGLGGTPASDSFDLLVANTNDDPVVNSAIANQNATEDSLFSFTFDADTFTDVDNDAVLTYSAQLADGSALPSWLSFDANTRTFTGIPENADVGSLSIEIIADDGVGGTPATDSFELLVANTNDDPVVNNAIANQNATEDSVFNFTFNADTFTDVDSDAVLTYNAQLTNGSALPSWLSFDANTRTFTGTPLNADVGSLSITVTADDGQGGTVATDNFAIVIANTNDDPTLNNAIADQNATEDSLFSFTFDADTFTDVDSDAVLTYSAQLADGSALPSWLSFDENTRTFTGTPANADVGSLSIEVIADDGLGGTPASDSFDLLIANTNDDPVVNNPIANQNAIEDSLFSLTFDADTFTDVDSDAVLTYSAQLADGSTLPTWLSFDANTRTFTGTPANADVGSLSVEVIADDGLGGTPATDSFDLLIANTNDDPVVNNAIANQNATEDSLFSFTFDADTFTDLDVDSLLTYSVQLTDGSALPTWLSFDASTRTFSGTPSDTDVGSLAIEVIADDGLGGISATDNFELLIANTNDDPVVNNAIANQNATADSLFSLTFDADTFTDVDSDAVLTYSAQLADGSALPSWLSFDANTRTFSGTPLNADVGSLAIEVIADDGVGDTPAIDSFELLIASNNNNPVVNNAIADQNATEDSLFSFTFDADTFTDADVDSVLTYSAQLADGSALPSWLSFDANTRTFTGTPANTDVGSLSIEVIADDGLGGNPATDSFELLIANTNDDPVVNNAIANQNATEDSLFSFTFASDTFTDVDAGSVLTYSAQLADGSALPAWLSFDANTNTFSGTPENADVGSLSIEVIADDGLGGTPASDSFDLLVTNTNDDPVVNSAIANQNATEDSLFSFTFDADTFTDVDSDAVLTYSAQLADGSALPSWLSFDANTRTFSGTPENTDVGSLSIEVIADDGLGGNPATDSFELLIANTNDDPVVNNAIANQNATEDSLFSFTFASDTFTDVDVGTVLTYSAQLADGSALPAWLSFDANTSTFTGTPANADVGSLSIEITADDGFGGIVATDTFALMINNINDDPNGAVIINGELVEGELLTADTTFISDEDGLGTFIFQWQKDGRDILGANTASYQLQESDIGANISVKVSYQDARGTFESIKSQSISIPFDELVEENDVDSNFTFIPVEVETTQEVATENVEEKAIEEIEEIQKVIDQDVLTELGELFQDQGVAFEIDDNEANIFVAERNNKPVNEEKVTLVDISAENDGLLKDNYLAYEDPLLLLESNSFIRELDDMRQDINQEINFNKTIVGSSLAVSAGISAGYVAWLARSGVLLSSVLTTLPMWRFIDPLPILSQATGPLDNDDESLESIVEDGSVDDENDTQESDEENNK